MAAQPPADKRDESDRGESDRNEGCRRGFLEDVIRGLSELQKTLPCKYLYDEAGSELFEQICKLEDYYLTRTEAQIFSDHLAEMAQAIGPDAVIIEPGAGNCAKAEPLLASLERPAAYLPMDISPEILLAARRRIHTHLPNLDIHAGVGDFTEDETWAAQPPMEARRRVIFFPGSTIGNFDPDQARGLLRAFASRLNKGDGMLIGTDLDKDPVILERAYNDSEQVTARFNKNLLTRINNELGADFDLSRFAHRSFYHPLRCRVEMHLVSLTRQSVSVAGRAFAFLEGETIHTENSHKYSLAGFRDTLRSTGFVPIRHWSDSSSHYAIHFAEVH
ncbi:L-histidine N(alpha)-methyltransferase [Microbulbifer aestuariivivens]